MSAKSESEHTTKRPMASGDAHRGPAKRDMILDQGAKHDAYLQRMIDQERAEKAERGELPSYDDTTEITATAKGLTARIGQLPPRAKTAIAYALSAVLVIAAAAAAVVAVVRALR